MTPEFHDYCFDQSDQSAHYDGQQDELSVGDVTQHQTHRFTRVEAEMNHNRAGIGVARSILYESGVAEMISKDDPRRMILKNPATVEREIRRAEAGLQNGEITPKVAREQIAHLNAVKKKLQRESAQ